MREISCYREGQKKARVPLRMSFAAVTLKTHNMQRTMRTAWRFPFWIVNDLSFGQFQSLRAHVEN